MATGRPVLDVTTAGWTNLNGSTTNLYANVDETTESAADAVSKHLPIRPFALAGTLPGENSRASYTTALGTPCQNLVAHALATVDNAHKVRFIIPDNIDMNQLTPIVFVLHGVGDDEDIITTGSVGTNGMTDEWLDAGWPVLAANGDGVSWGNETARLGYLDIWTWIAGLFNCPGFLIYGVSMGGCSGLNFLLDVQANALPCLAFAGNSAATNFQYTYDNNGTLRPAMRTAYGLGAVTSSDATYIAAVDTADGGHDPQKQTAAEFPTIPFRFYVGNSDSSISKPNNTDLFVAKLTAASWVPEVAEVVYSGGHVAAASFQPVDCNAFFQRALDA